MLTLKSAFHFPLATAEARRDLLIGGIALILGLWIFGWILNLGHRLNVVHRLAHNDPPYFRGFGNSFTKGLIAFAAITAYLTPALLLAWAKIWPASALALALALFTLPGGMTVYAVEGHLRTLSRPDRAFARAWERRGPYLHAWGIAILAIALSSTGLLALGVGFAFTSVWAWQVAGYAFTVALYAR